MCPTITYNNKATEVRVAPVSNNTVFTLRSLSKGVCILQNDDVVGFLEIPTMKIVRSLRKLYPMAKYELI